MSLGPVILAGTLLATFTGSGAVTGGPNSLAFSYGFWPTMLIVLPSPRIGIGVLTLIAHRIRALGLLTVSQILETKYGQGAKALSAVIIVLAYMGIVSYQFKGLGFVLSVATGAPVGPATLIAVGLIVFLATVGGMRSVAPTDALSATLSSPARR